MGDLNCKHWRFSSLNQSDKMVSKNRRSEANCAHATGGFKVIKISGPEAWYQRRVKDRFKRIDKVLLILQGPDIVGYMVQNTIQIIDYRSKVLQSRDSTIDEEVRNLQSLLDDLQHLRDNWEGVYNEASLVAGEMDISPLLKENRNSSRESRASSDAERQSAAVVQFKVNVFLRIIDNVIAEIDRRFQRINDINNKCSFLWQYPNLSEMELSKQAAAFGEVYKFIRVHGRDPIP